MHSTSSRPPYELVFGLLGVGVLARVLPHPPNVTPLTALALFGGAMLPRRWAVLLPLGIIMLSDLVLGLHETIAFTWAGVALIGSIGWWLRRQTSLGRVMFASLLASSLFFILTNAGVWLLGERGTMYPHTAQGLWTCYVAALPFYRNALLGDLLMTVGVFQSYAWLARRVAPARVPSA